MRADGQFYPSLLSHPSQHRDFIVKCIRSSMESKSQTTILSWLGFEPTTSWLRIHQVNHLTAVLYHKTDSCPDVAPSNPSWFHLADSQLALNRRSRFDTWYPLTLIYNKRSPCNTTTYFLCSTYSTLYIVVKQIWTIVSSANACTIKVHNFL